ncbi:MAG: hypothetical protein J3R72DRAFT_510507 [Linnemannia gamsii]|nr:MAG: hypothetical protein J3R72DRAFT_510507 [Linnemannia gamsii]
MSIPKPSNGEILEISNATAESNAMPTTQPQPTHYDESHDSQITSWTKSSSPATALSSLSLSDPVGPPSTPPLPQSQHSPLRPHDAPKRMQVIMSKMNWIVQEAQGESTAAAKPSPYAYITKIIAMDIADSGLGDGKWIWRRRSAAMMKQTEEHMKFLIELAKDLEAAAKDIKKREVNRWLNYFDGGEHDFCAIVQWIQGKRRAIWLAAMSSNLPTVQEAQGNLTTSAKHTLYSYIATVVAMDISISNIVSGSDSGRYGAGGGTAVTTTTTTCKVDFLVVIKSITSCLNNMISQLKDKIEFTRTLQNQQISPQRQHDHYPINQKLSRLSATMMKEMEKYKSFLMETIKELKVAAAAVEGVSGKQEVNLLLKRLVEVDIRFEQSFEAYKEKVRPLA